CRESPNGGRRRLRAQLGSSASRWLVVGREGERRSVMVVGGLVLGRTAAAILALSIVVLLTSATAYGAQPLGALTQLSGTAGCFTYNGASEDGAGTCS